MSSKRETEIKAFLKETGWGDADRSAVPGDASARRYERLSMQDVHAVLMDVPMDMMAQEVTLDASVEDRQAHGYNGLARIAGINPVAFVCVTNALVTRGFSAPKILAADLPKGLVLLEDLGDNLYARAVEKTPESEAPLYKGAIDCLAAIYRSSFPKDLTYKDVRWRIRDYDEAALLAETDLCLDWYAKDLGHDIRGVTRDEFHDLWREAFKAFDAHAPGLCLRDYHAENLFWLPEREATSRVGLIDYQDALFVHPSYDLVSIIEDARRDVSPGLHAPLIERFCEKSGINYDDEFLAAYTVMGAQRNAKILGIFVRLAKRDGKPHYRKLIPRVAANMQRNLENPALSDLKIWFERNIPELWT